MPAPAPSPWTRYTPLQKIGSVVVVLVLVAAIAWFKWVAMDKTTDTERAAKRYISAVDETLTLAKTVRDPASARAASPKLRNSLAELDTLKHPVSGDRVPGDERMHIKDMLADTRQQVTELDREMSRINADPELRAIVAGEK